MNCKNFLLKQKKKTFKKNPKGNMRSRHRTDLRKPEPYVGLVLWPV